MVTGIAQDVGRGLMENADGEEEDEDDGRFGTCVHG